MQKKPAVKTTGGTCQVAYWWRRWDARGDMREDTNIKGADTQSDFWLIIYSVPQWWLAEALVFPYLTKIVWFQKIISAILLLVSMVATLAVITELGSQAAGTYSISTGCHKNIRHYRYTKEKCQKFKELNGWFQTLVISADILLVLSLVALLAIFADWILSTRKVTTCIPQHACSDWLISVFAWLTLFRATITLKTCHSNHIDSNIFKLLMMWLILWSL